MNAGVTVHNIDVLAFPPSEDWRILVSFESRKGIKLPKEKYLISLKGKALRMKKGEHHDKVGMGIEGGGGRKGGEGRGGNGG